MDLSKLSPEISAVIMLIGLNFLVGIASSLVSIVNAFRRRPSIDQDLINYVRHPELITAKAELKAEISELRELTNKALSEAFTRMATQQAAVEKTFQDIERVLGRIEGRLERCPNVCPTVQPVSTSPVPSRR